MKVYLASGWFDKQQELDEKNIYNIISDYFDIFRPKTDNNLNKTDFSKFEFRLNGFKQNVNKINECDFVIANISSRDSGTLFEIGYAYAIKKPILLIDLFRISKKPNLMLAMAGNLGMCLSLSNLKEMCELFQHFDNKKLKKIKNYYKGDIE